MCKTEGCKKPIHSKEMCSNCYAREWHRARKARGIHYKDRLPTKKCLDDDCLNETASKWGYCDTHKSKRQWAAQKQAKAEWFAKQPEDNITDAVIRYALNNDIALNLFTNTKTEGDCLVWNGAISSNGYGQIAIRVRFGKGEGKHFSHPVLTHRLAYATKDDLPPSQSGPKPDTLTINHICRNKRCVNPSHLEVLTQKENFEYSPPPKGGWKRNIDMSIKGTCLCGADFVGAVNKKWCSKQCYERHRIRNRSAA